MGLVNELQESAERDDVVTVIRKAKRLSSKLGRPDINEWLEHEQSGYPNGSVVPEYRSIGGTLCYNTNGYIPAGYGMLQRGIVPLPGFNSFNLKVPQWDSISEVMALIAAQQRGNGLYIDVGPDMSRELRSMFQSRRPEILNQLTFLLQLNESEIRDIPEQAKNKVLDWACKLESAGVTGDGVSFSTEEKQLAEGVVFNIINSTVDQISNSGLNVRNDRNG
jgi:hypothetical protein